MNCHYCGTPLRDNDIFCRHCGTRQQSAAPAESETVVAAAVPAPAAVQIPVEPVAAEVPVAPAAEEVPARPATVYKEKSFDWHPYGAPAKVEPLVVIDRDRFNEAPKLQLPVKRSLAKMIFLGILTAGIYPMVIWSRLVTEVNLVASRHDGERSMPFFGMLLLSPLTLGIHSLVWIHKLCRRMGNELRRRNISYVFGARDFWIWAFLMGMLSSICLGTCSALAAAGFDVLIVIWALLTVGILTTIGTFVFTAKLMNASNALNGDFNIHG